MAQPALSNSDLQLYSRDHLVYEMGMLHWTSAILYGMATASLNGTISETVRNSLLNSFASHARNLIDFLYLGHHFKRATNSDVVIEDFIDPADLIGVLPPISTLLEEAKIKANKQVAHLTTQRMQYEISGKEWQFMRIYTEIMKAFLKVSHLFPAEKVSQEFMDYVTRKEVPIAEIKIDELLEQNSPVGIRIAASVKRDATAVTPVIRT